MTRARVGKLVGVAAFMLLSVPGVVAQSNKAPADGSALRDPQLAQRAYALRDRLQSLAPDPRTDVVLPDVSVALGSGKGRAISLRGELLGGAQEQSYFWTIDLRRGTYRIFTLSNPTADARRIQAHLKSLGSDVTATQLWQQLMERQLRLGERQQLLAEGTRIDRQPAPSEKDGSAIELNLVGETCSGYMDVGIQAWEPARYISPVAHLTETYVSANFGRSAGNWGWWGVAGCWANPQTFAYTTWYTTACRPSASPWRDGYLDLSSWGEYINWDFFMDAVPTYVYQQAAANYSSGFGSWSTFHYDEGEFSWFVTGVSYAYGQSSCTY
jgi:hypothetical protein